MVPKAGLEPARPCGQQILSLLCLHSIIWAIGGELGTRTLNALLHNGFQDRPTTNYRNSPYGWGSRDRTYEMSESKSDALPLGYAPMYKINFLLSYYIYSIT